MNSCDAIITLSGGSGTLTEIAMAYQLDIPIIAIKGCGGWSDKLASTFIDNRNRRRVIAVETPEDAVKTAIEEAKAYLDKYNFQS